MSLLLHLTGASLTLAGVEDIEGGDRLPARVLGVDDCIFYHTLHNIHHHQMGIHVDLDRPLTLLLPSSSTEYSFYSGSVRWRSFTVTVSLLILHQCHWDGFPHRSQSVPTLSVPTLTALRFTIPQGHSFFFCTKWTRNICTRYYIVMFHFIYIAVLREQSTLPS